MWGFFGVALLAVTLFRLLWMFFEMREEIQELQAQVEWLLAYLGLEVDDEGFIVPVDPGGPGHRVE